MALRHFINHETSSFSLLMSEKDKELTHILIDKRSTFPFVDNEVGQLDWLMHSGKMHS